MVGPMESSSSNRRGRSDRGPYSERLRRSTSRMSGHNQRDLVSISPVIPPTALSDSLDQPTIETNMDQTNQRDLLSFSAVTPAAILNDSQEQLTIITNMDQTDQIIQLPLTPDLSPGSQRYVNEFVTDVKSRAQNFARYITGSRIETLEEKVDSIVKELMDLRGRLTALETKLSVASTKADDLNKFLSTPS